MKERQGNKSIIINGKRQKAIIEFDFDDYTLYVFQGILSTFDIFIKYKKGKMRIRTPKHIHWAVDVLIKMQGQKKLTKRFLCEVKALWVKVEPLSNNDYNSLRLLVENNAETIKIEEYKKLNKYGEYPVDFLFVLMLLLSVQEKTNRSDAYMFGSIINELLESDYDIFSIVSKASFKGRNNE
ncbi:MAG: hypothetical protein J5762_00415 [Clostridia bacterium]|nr:hypothetical protein [Clostridia bacterium]